MSDEPQASPPVAKFTIAVYVQPIPFICVLSEAPSTDTEPNHQHFVFNEPDYPIVKQVVEHAAHVLGFISVRRHQQERAAWN